MITSFNMNGLLWRVREVDPDDDILIDRTGRKTVATTDYSTQTVYLSKALAGDFKIKVFIHELGHCLMQSYGLIAKIHSMTYSDCHIEMEEFICNILADYGREVYSICERTFRDDAIKLVPLYMEKLVA